MLSQIQKRKLTRYFNVLDVDMNGVLEKSDFVEIIENLAALRNFDEGSDEYKYIESSIMMIWENAQSYGCAVDPDKITLEEWLDHLAQVLSSERVTESYVKKLSKDIFDLVDTSSDALIQYSEYAQILKAFRVEDGIAKFAFPKLDINQRGHLTREDFVNIVTQFHLSQDRESPENYLFGPY